MKTRGNTFNGLYCIEYKIQLDSRKALVGSYIIILHNLGKTGLFIEELHFLLLLPQNKTVSTLTTPPVLLFDLWVSQQIHFTVSVLEGYFYFCVS